MSISFTYLQAWLILSKLSYLCTFTLIQKCQLLIAITCNPGCGTALCNCKTPEYFETWRHWQIIEKLSVRAPPGEVKLKLMKEIAAEHNVEWDATDAEAELTKVHEDLLVSFTPNHYCQTCLPPNLFS